MKIHYLHSRAVIVHAQGWKWKKAYTI